MRFPHLPCLCLAAASLSAQNYVLLPSTANPTAELPGYSQLPLMQPNARVQMFYDATEVGSAPIVLDQLALRFDGPIPAVGAPGPFTITRLQIRIGVTAIAMPGAQFAANLTAPLTTAFDAPWTYLPDDGSAAPHPWGGPGGTLTFPFTTLVPVTVAPGQWLVIDVLMEGNNISSFGFAHAMLDGATTTGGLTVGSAAAYGTGCSASPLAPAAAASATGLYGPGGAHSLSGTGLGAGAPVLAVFGLSNTAAFVPLPFVLPGTTCSLLASPDFTVPTFADATGAVNGAAAVPLALAANPAFSGLVVYEQMASLVGSANPWGIVLSNGVAVTLGTFASPGRGTYTVAHDTDANAAFANVVRAFGYAVRLRTL
ncbi:MAG: hypothetical protein WAT39_20210 [Planctomycetota bacterium]